MTRWQRQPHCRARRQAQAQRRPAALEECAQWGGATVLIRPVRPEDEPMYERFLAVLTPDDVRHRFFGAIGQSRHQDPARMVRLDHDREMAFLAIRKDADGKECMLGEARAVAGPHHASVEFGLMVRSDLKNRGLGTLLLTRLIRYCNERGTQALCGVVLADNAAMLEVARRCGFSLESSGIGAEVRIRLALVAADPSMHAPR